jgi:UDP-N-acetylglucosamine acyltransferase
MDIHSTARVHESAKLGTGVSVGANASVGADVEVGDGCVIDENASLRGPLVIGEGCIIGFSAVIGHKPQVYQSAGPFGTTRIGARNEFREFTQVHRSMKADGETVIGDDCFFMANAHVAHDCVVGNRVVIANNSPLAGHVHVQDGAFISANSAIHQFSRIGESAMVAGMTAVPRDVPPFCTVTGIRPARLDGLNIVGLRRSGVPSDVRLALKAAYRTLFRSDLPLAERLTAVDRSVAEVDRLVRFIEESPRGVVGFGGRV